MHQFNADIFRFNEEVPFTNNLAERDIRPAKVKLKVSNCFRNFKGAEIYARIAGFVSTARKNNRNVYSELYATFCGHNFLTRQDTLVNSYKKYKKYCVLLKYYLHLLNVPSVHKVQKQAGSSLQLQAE